MHHLKKTVFTLSVHLLCATAWAQTAPDAGALLRQTEQGLKSPSPPSVLPLPKAAPGTTTAQPDEATVQVHSFKFVGNSLLNSEHLNSALASFANRKLTLQQLKQVADAVTAVYREAGWTARAYLPRQEIESGVVTIEIVEAIFGGVSMQGPTSQRIEASRLVDMAEANLRKGQPLHANDLDRTLLLLDDLPGVSVAGNLIEGQRDGETNLALIATDDTLVSGNTTLDNQGSRATGIERVSLNLNLNSPARLGDLLSNSLMHTQGIDYVRSSYNLPMGNQGWRAGLHASSLKYKVLTSYDANATGTRGTADTAGFEASYPLLRSQLSNAQFTWNYDDKTLENYVANALNSNYKIKAHSIGINGNSIDNWGNGGVTTASATVTQGRVLNEGSANAQQDADGARVAGGYSKLNLSLSRLQSINTELSFYAAVSAQMASKNLDSSERVYLGGATGVRAFPASEAGGATGRTLTLELRQRLDNALTLTGFYDYGHVGVNKHNANAATGTPISNLNAYALQGYGASLAWQDTQGLELKATLAKRSASNPAADSTTGFDSDKTKQTKRVWLSAGVAF